MASSQEKTEKPTDKRLEEARKRGQIPKSKELVSVGILIGGAVSVYFSGGLMLSHFRQMFEDLWKEGLQSASPLAAGAQIFSRTVFHLTIMIGPTLLTVLFMAIGLTALQTKGINFSLEAAQFKLSHLSPAQGFKKLFSVRAFVELIKSLLKLFIVGYAIYAVLQNERAAFVSLAGQGVNEVADAICRLGFKIIYRVAGIMLLVSLLDYYYQRWQHEKDLRMTRQELKEEHKQTEGDPYVKSRIRAIQRALAKQRMLAAIPKATMVVTNPTHIAIALAYNQGMEAPKVVGRGVDFLAKKIIKIARKHGVPVIQNPPLARALYKQVKLEETIPATLYRAVAKLLAYVYQQQKRTMK